MVVSDVEGLCMINLLLVSWHSMIALVLLSCLNGTRIGPMVCLTGMCVGLVSVGCSAWWELSDNYPCPGDRQSI
jgi:ammonia channel protein AmtB